MSDQQNRITWTTLDEALIRWSVICRSWQDTASGSQPVLGAFLAGWFARAAGCSIDAERTPLKDSVRAGWRECNTVIGIKERTNDSSTEARAHGTVPAMVLPCNMSCPKCGSADINRLFRGKGTDRPSEKYGHPISRFESAESWTAVAWRDHIMHHCRVCQYDWQTPSLPRRRQNKNISSGD